MKTWALGWMLVLACAGVTLGDELVWVNGQSVKGSFEGFRDHRFWFKTSEGKIVSEFASNIRTIMTDTSRPVSAVFVGKRYDDVQFKGVSRLTVRLVRGAEVFDEPLVLLKSVEPTAEEGDAAPANDETATAEAPQPEPKEETPPEPNAETKPAAVPALTANGGREWKRSGKWREVETPGVAIISHGEVVDISETLKEGVVNVVHFHLASAHSSVRQGNYLETLAGKSKGRVVIRRVDLPGWKAPMCVELDLKSLPQFWFYTRSGRLTKKLVDRFTEADIELALKEALRMN